METKLAYAHSAVDKVFVLAFLLAGCGREMTGNQLLAPIVHSDHNPAPPGSGAAGSSNLGGVTVVDPGSETAASVRFTVTEEYTYDDSCVGTVQTTCTVTKTIPLNESAVASCLKDPNSFVAATCMPASFKERILASVGAKVFVAHMPADATHPAERYQILLRLSQDTQRVEEVLSLDAVNFQHLDGGAPFEVDRI